MTVKIGVCSYKNDKPVCCTYYHLKDGICTESTNQSTAQKSEQSVQPTILTTIATTEPRLVMTKRSSSMLKTNTKTGTAGSFSSTYLALTSLEATPMPGSTGVPPEHTSQTSVIIIVGGLVCSFLIFILGIQIHSKFLKRKNASRRKIGENLINLYEMEDVYNHIEDGHVSMVSDKYDVVANQNDAESSTSSNISPKFDKPNKNLAPTCVYSKTTRDGNICHSPTQSQDNLYIDPVAKLCNGYTDLVASPPRNEMQEETGENNQKEAFQKVDSSLVNEEQNIQKENYLDVE